ncbi:MAG: glycosyltransferase family 2 protein, partial [Oscillospiraceae bacterium]|nr:glycosyltransferase family 2 protein [Oscillospiraceae bacterium]
MSTTNTPMISVIMGIYNCQDTLAEAMDSLLHQTYRDFEIILCNDGSTDNTLSVAKDYVARYPGKVILVENERNMGLNFTLNHCLQHARGKYIARMDGDDIAPPTRFQKEVEFLETHPQFGLVSVHLELFDAEGV